MLGPEVLEVGFTPGLPSSAHPKDPGQKWGFAGGTFSQGGAEGSGKDKPWE